MVLNSIVEYTGEVKSECGYCKSKSSSVSYGMWADRLTVDEYQKLIDKGWRRCGEYCYKPSNSVTCCPCYTIRCEALNLKLSKSQKKTLRKMNAFLNGEMVLKSKGDSATEIKSSVGGKDSNGSDTASVSGKRSRGTRKSFKPGVGRDESKPVQRKAKMIRAEKSKNKSSTPQSEPEEESTQKDLENIISTTRNILEVRLVPASSSPETLLETWALYKKYQMTIHKEEEKECGFEGFHNFLVTSPLPMLKTDGGPPCGYGTFHHQYWFKGKLIAVGVLDILPKCVSSVYFIYDPHYSDLSLGTYGSLREIELVRSLAASSPELRYYYLGFYIHSCPKMRYKANFSPSFLLCPEAYTWHPINECLPKLNSTKYCRMNTDLSYVCDNDNFNLNEIPVVWNGRTITYGEYKRLTGTNELLARIVAQYASMVGHSCAASMLLQVP